MTRKSSFLSKKSDIETRNYVEWFALDIVKFVQYLTDKSLDAFTGYGFKPQRLFWLLPIFILLASLPSHLAWQEGSLVPNSGPILVSQAWEKIVVSEEFASHVWSAEMAPTPMRDADPIGALQEWTKIAPGRDWETFQPIAYAADLVLPIISFGQTDAWAPSTTRGPWGWHLWWLQWFFSASGWAISTYILARMTHIIQKN